MMEALARSMPAVPAESVHEPIMTMGEISKQFNVSTKTISRWRERGLIGRRIVRNGRRQMGYLKSVVDRFLATNKDRVERSSRFSQLSAEEKEDILRRAKRLARVNSSTLTEVSRRIARRLGRSAETVRYTIKHYDKQHPEQALFPAISGTLDEDQKQTIYNLHRRGISVETLADRFRRTRTSVYRILNEVRAKRLLDQPLEYIYHPSFDDPSAEAEVLGRMPGHEEYETERQR